jgi:GT2 family glycosyltransferase
VHDRPDRKHYSSANSGSEVPRPAAAAGLALIVPAFNAANYLPRLMRTAHAQLVPFDEIWVYDDGSTDDTARVARELGAQVVRGATNRGPSHGRNVLAQASRAKWLHFHDADDALLPEFTKATRPYMVLDRHDVVLFDYETRDNESGMHRYVRRFDWTELDRDPIRFAIVEQINAIHGLYRRDTFLAVGGFDTAKRLDEDPDLHLRLALAGCRFAGSPDVQVINYLRSDSVSATSRHECVQARYETMCLAARAVGSIYATEIATKLWSVASGAATFLDWPLADKAAAKALALAGARGVGKQGLFQLLVRVDYRLALRLRELSVRGFKSSVRHPNHRNFYAALASIIFGDVAVEQGR